MNNAEYDIIFYKSLKTERWWFEVPIINKKKGKVIVASSNEEYQRACKHEIPDRWWKAFQRIN